MKNKKKKTLPKFKNIIDEANFWDNKDISDFLPMKEVKIKCNRKILKEESIVIRVQSKVKKRLEMIAINEGLSLSTMLRMWFMERMTQSKGL